MTQAKIAELARKALVFHPEQADLIGLEGTDDTIKPYPIDALGDTIRGVALRIQEKTQAPLAICAQSVLTAAALVAQTHLNIRLPHGAERPVSLFFVTVAASGERKSAADGLAMSGIKDYQKSQWKAYEPKRQAWQDAYETWEANRKRTLNPKGKASLKVEALSEIGPKPVKPPEPTIIFREPTWEAIVKSLTWGYPSAILYTDEGGAFLQGHAMDKDRKIRTAANLSLLWDGEAINHQRAGDGNTLSYGRRLSAHLMVQPEIGIPFLSDPLLVGQGLHSRVLACFPPSTMGTRFYKEPSALADIEIHDFQQKICDALEQPWPLAENTQNELKPRALGLNQEAKDLWADFHDSIEQELHSNGGLRDISGVANKAPEMAIRLAAVLGFIDNPAITAIDGALMAQGIALMQYYLAERLRLLETRELNPLEKDALRLKRWILERYTGDCLTIALASKNGPIRSKAERNRDCFELLEQAGLLVKALEPVEINGKSVAEAWRIVR